MSRPDNSFKELAGVPVHYDRLPPPHDYGTRGKPTQFHTTVDFQQKLDACFTELWDRCPLGRSEVITSAGAFTEKPGFHGEGKAFDLDGLFWAHKSFVTRQYPADPQLYLGVDAVLRRHFGTVLNFHYNAAHRDHFHIQDDSKPVGFRKVKSIVVFLQAALSEVHNQPVDIDGIYGPQTSGALRKVLDSLDISGDLSDRDEWLEFLAKTTDAAFTASTQIAAPEEENPFELLQGIYRVIDEKLENVESRKTVESAVDRFANHEQTQQWLDRFRS